MDDYKIIVEQEHQTVMDHFEVEPMPAEEQLEALNEVVLSDSEWNRLLPMISNEQRRIVSILDTFESSIQNLEAQLYHREKQYEYYRNKLFTF